MIEILVFSAAIIIVLIIINGGILSALGLYSGDFSNVIEGVIVVFILYIVIVTVFGSIDSPSFLSNIKGIPYVAEIERYGSMKAIFDNKLSLFALEFAKLVPLTFIILLASQMLPRSLGGSGFVGRFIRGIVLVLLGIFVNHYCINYLEKTSYFPQIVTVIECFITGSAIALTPLTILTNIFGGQAGNSAITYTLKQIQKTKIYSTLVTAVNDSLLLVVGIMIFEASGTTITAAFSDLYVILFAMGPIFIMLTGMYILIKSI